MQARHGLEFALVLANAEAVPLPDGCADLVVSEYGASLWCEPAAWIAEAARLLRPAGQLAFLTNSLLVALTAPASGACDDRLVRAQRGLYALTWRSMRTTPVVRALRAHAERACAPVGGRSWVGRRCAVPAEARRCRSDVLDVPRRRLHDRRLRPMLGSGWGRYPTRSDPRIVLAGCHGNAAGRSGLRLAALGAAGPAGGSQSMVDSAGFSISAACSRAAVSAAWSPSRPR